MIKNFDWSKLQRKNEPNNRVSVCGNGIEDLAGHVSLVEYHLEEAKEDLSKLSARFTALIQQNSALAADNERLTEELIRACAELSVIKKQDPLRWALDHYELGIGSTLFDSEYHAVEFSSHLAGSSKAIPLYAEPVHQHSFTISGIGTFYADSEVCITYLERLHGVGGKANLKEVTDAR